MDEELNFCPASKWSCHMSCDGMAASCIFYFLSLLVQNSFVSPVSRGYQNVTLLEPETPNTWTLYWVWIIQCEMKTRKEREVWCKNYTADVGHWHSQVLWDYLLFGCYSILISFQHQHWSSQHIKWTEHRSSVCSVFVPFSINRSLCPCIVCAPLIDFLACGTETIHLYHLPKNKPCQKSLLNNCTLSSQWN